MAALVLLGGWGVLKVPCAGGAEVWLLMPLLLMRVVLMRVLLMPVLLMLVLLMPVLLMPVLLTLAGRCGWGP